MSSSPSPSPSTPILLSRSPPDPTSASVSFPNSTLTSPPPASSNASSNSSAPPTLAPPSLVQIYLVALFVAIAMGMSYTLIPAANTTVVAWRNTGDYSIICGGNK